MFRRRNHGLCKLLRASCALPTIFAAGCVAEVDTPSRDNERAPELDVQRSKVVGGREVSTCDWPSTVRVLGASTCTGTLIHPRVVTTAAHCLNGTSARVVFGGPRDATSFTVTARCRAGARRSTGVSSGSDWAYCVLPEEPRLAALPVTPPLVGCEAQRFLKPGARAWVVGYGTTGPRGGGGGIKREVEVTINAVDRPRGTIDVGDATVGACHGDSGGPLYLHLLDALGNDYGYRVIGSTSGPGARNCDCSCSTSYVNIANHIAELERTEGIDVTPCTDANGAWAPGPDCGALPSARARASGAFPSCTVPRTLGRVETCGPNGDPIDVDGAAFADAGPANDGGVRPRDAGEAKAGADGGRDGGAHDAAASDAAADGARDASGAASAEDDRDPEEASDEDEPREPEEPDDDEVADEGDHESDEAYDTDRNAARASNRGCSLHRGAEADAFIWLLLIVGLVDRRVRHRARVGRRSDERQR